VHNQEAITYTQLGALIGLDRDDAIAFVQGLAKTGYLKIFMRSGDEINVKLLPPAIEAVLDEG
jgi:hypothetical protein